MSAPLDPRLEARLKIVIDLGERLFILILFATFIVRLSHTLGLRPYNVLVLISEGLVAFFIVVRRRAAVVTMRGWDWIAAVTGTALPMTVRAGGHPLLPDAIGTILMLVGLVVAIVAKLTLRMSFGVAAANRGAVISGPYRIVRHPMYAGYLLVYAGFFLNNPSLWNFAVYAGAVAMLVARIFAEEGVLKEDPAYAAYKAKVHYRLVPGVM
ncbi:MAG TPA: isoprenylcysteine carboxylmethyltransferase family protein [Rhizomicrobium sp.]|nr:isoprenylcysteine carboxylmethyltransferase family protein [Rhizomicrobium sp.]